MVLTRKSGWPIIKSVFVLASNQLSWRHNCVRGGLNQFFLVLLSLPFLFQKSKPSDSEAAWKLSKAEQSELSLGRRTRYVVHACRSICLTHTAVALEWLWGILRTLKPVVTGCACWGQACLGHVILQAICNRYSAACPMPVVTMIDPNRKRNSYPEIPCNLVLLASCRV